MTPAVDMLIVGAGTAGLPAAIFAARRGARVLLVEAGPVPGGTLKRAAGHLSAGGTRLQAERGISDSPEAHAADILRITKGTADPAMVAFACELAPAVVAWLDALGLDWDPGCPAILHALEAYSTPRTYWGTRRAVSIADVLLPELDREIAAGRVDLWTGSRLTGLERRDGTVTGGWITRADGRESRVEAAQTILTTGGYCADAGLFADMTGGLPLYGGAEPTSRGDGLRAARAVGAATYPARHFLPHVGGIEDPPGSRRVARADNPVLMPHRLPWEIYVDRQGHRCLREDEPDRVAWQRAMTRVPEMTFWILFDQAAREASPDLLPSWAGARLERAWNAHPSFTRADGLAALAVAAGIDPDGLQATVAAYNDARARGAPDPMGREHRPLPLTRAPFYAVRNHGTTATASGGLRVDQRLAVLDTAGRPIPGLFAAGEILGRELLSGDSFVGGMSITPALGFGRWLGEIGTQW